MTKRKDRLEALEQVRDKILTEGIEAAADALIAVCRDTNAPAPARSTAGTSLLRAAGFFDKRTDDGSGKELHEMTARELEAHLQQLERERKALKNATDNGGDVFG